MELKSSRNYPTNDKNHATSQLRIYDLGGVHALMKVISRNQARPGLWLAHAWFKEMFTSLCALPDRNN